MRRSYGKCDRYGKKIYKKVGDEVNRSVIYDFLSGIVLLSGTPGDLPDSYYPFKS
jgi:hypothetical protein